ncbi:divalent-cation tolerance protein CutA [Desulfoplanes formicivorans]|uniref:Cation tolerance protein CutA n=1 Tax=Desulfoplanes formicivorans TaxID=1592317 RepID=A0A194ABZ7_9BACT|nr:divalent-cation tolerance protein CutA [Desulfoplanes formicivorans]GAU07672.1 cation tolerance protein CutA [Desulfoplanes formicivorans]
MKEPTHIIVLTTCPSPKEAKQLAAGLVECGLAACVQCSAITSTYTWQGRVTSEQETQVWIKTKNSLYTRVENFIQRVHPYDVPEILALPVIGGSRTYLQWIDQVTQND